MQEQKLTAKIELDVFVYHINYSLDTIDRLVAIRPI